MIRLVGAELLKLRTTLALWAYLGTAVVVAAITAAAAIGSAPDVAVRDERWVLDNVLASAGSASLFALLLGIVGFTNEFRHGTATQTFLVTPVRERVLAAKLAAFALVGGLLAVVATVVTLAIAIPWLESRGGVLPLDDRAFLVLGGAVLAAVLWGALGAAVGGLARSQVFALVGTLVWILILENLLGAFVSEISPYLPGRTPGAIIGSELGDTGLSRVGAVLLTLAYVGGFAALAAVMLRTRDVG